MKIDRRNVLRLATGAALVAGVPRTVAAETARPLAERLASYADNLRYEDLDAATVERVKAHLIDTLGCGIAALDEPVVRICRDVALASGAGNATVIGAKKRSSAELASFANGAAFRYYDLNDNYATAGFGTVHPSDHISACLAVAEVERASTHDLIPAIVLAYEINCRLLDASDAATRGWDLPLFSLPAVALAAGKLMKLTPAQLAQAVNLALNDHIPMGQTRTQVNSDWKGLADAATTTAIYMPTRTLSELVTKAVAEGLDPATPAIAIARATRPDQQAVHAPVGELARKIATANLPGPVLVMLGATIGRTASRTSRDAHAARQQRG